MLRRICLLIVFIFISCSKSDIFLSEAENGVQQVISLGGSKNDVAKSVINTSDGGFIVIGSTQSTDGDIKNKTDESYDFWVLKFNSNNKLEWEKTYGGSGDDRGNAILESSDGNYVLLGYSSSSDGDVSLNNGLRDFWLVKINSLGNILWEKSFGYAGIDEGNTIIETSDNNYIISGVLDVTSSLGEGNINRSSQRHAGGDYWTLKVSSEGNIIWARYFGGTFTDTALGLSESNTNDILTVGSSDSKDVDISNNQGTYDFWVVKSKENGNMIWEKSFGGSEIDEARGVVKTSDGYVLVGDTRSNDKNVSANNGGADLWIIKIDDQGNLLWDKNYGGSSFDVARSINKTSDNGFIITGSSRSSDGNVTENKGQNDAWIIRLNSAGNLLWQRTVGGTKIDFAYDGIQNAAGNIIIVGETQSSDGNLTENKGFSDVLIIKI